ncbi:N-terminal Xaa-Pro-Lys N-methyltransferase 1-like [Watersipora subatra]|uniref:N-terminal Xaa-Pro-Lys N-methyltransferase 1-like n=1 Tax=Watersipora subatra TaxID=2589382 RepID=UPI00355BE174
MDGEAMQAMFDQPSEPSTAYKAPFKDIDTKDKFYTDALTYWSSIPPTVDGMLGGLEYITKTDVSGSTVFLTEVMNSEQIGRSRVLDCGAGIGRVTKNLLLPLFDIVDLLEVNPKFLAEAPAYIGAEKDRVGEYICKGMQDFTPSHTYDVIWCQWVVGHLTDRHLSEFLQRCKKALNKNGIICIKDNVANYGLFDKTDSSLMRSLKETKEVIEDAGLTIIKEEMQQGFPPDIYDVPMLAFR